MLNKKKLIENIINQPPVNQKTEIDKKKNLAQKWFNKLRDQICDNFTNIEHNFKIKKWGVGGVHLLRLVRAKSEKNEN